MPDERRVNGFGRVSYEFSPLLTAFAPVQLFGLSRPELLPADAVGRRHHPARQRLSAGDFGGRRHDAANLTSVSIGTSNAGFPAAGSDNSREVFRTVIGGDGEFDTGNIDWKWDAYYQVGIAKTNEMLTNTWLNSRVALAQDAMRRACRSMPPGSRPARSSAGRA